MAKKPAAAKPEKKDPRGDPHARIDAIVALLKANGLSLPPELGGELHPAGGAVEEPVEE